MVSHGLPESDWKTFRKLREVALERFCMRVLEELEPLRLDASRSHHERYLDIFRLLQERDEELAHAFNDPRRSRMIIQLAAIYEYGLLEPDELARFTPETRGTIESFAEEFLRRNAGSVAAGAGPKNRCYPVRVADPASKLEAKALKLPPEKRARLAERLISSLDHEADADAEELWIQEAERRLNELDSGAVETIAAERVIEKARSSVR